MVFSRSVDVRVFFFGSFRNMLLLGENGRLFAFVMRLWL